MKMKLIRLMTLAAASFIAGTTFAISDTPVSPAEAEKIKTALEAFGCTAGEMEKGESSVFAFERNGEPAARRLRRKGPRFISSISKMARPFRQK
jgi:hypothetical protein